MSFPVEMMADRKPAATSAGTPLTGLSYPRPVLTLGTCVQDNTNQKTTERVEDFTQQENNCRILQVLINSTKVALKEMESHCASLLEKNHSLVQSIKQMDLSSLMYARDVLEQYNVTEKSTMSMQQWNQQQVEMAKQDLKEAEEMVEKQLGELQRELHELDSKLQASQEKLQILRTYRDKEFPGNMLRIGQLQRELQEHKEAQQAEKDDLEKLKNTKVDKMKDKKESMLKSTPEEKTKHFPPSSMKMAAFNCIMTKEIKLHKQIIKELKKDISDLLEQQLFLVESRREVRQEKFADVLLQRPKCTPDMEIILDIPLREKTII
ncbi:uncharacterized protein C20orf96 homolog isoform X2 [Microcaecilia unicolor]|uniref:Uncharacterized protein C20orf96 homolog isoform X2 n=1 Tax=Microcaecilia unicolor TaxID=1415580 RepID=A0A6P7YUA6_9AMPH|nr:uncharacterized protein C20orf96 homolog isoform X2 [Microcaecilia unicolor]